MLHTASSSRQVAANTSGLEKQGRIQGPLALGKEWSSDNPLSPLTVCSDYGHLGPQTKAVP